MPLYFWEKECFLKSNQLRHFTRVISAKTNIPRDFRPSYIRCMDSECQQLLEQYSNSGDPDIADHLVECLDNVRRARWEEMTSSLDFTHSSRKCWNLIRKLSSGQHLPSSTRPSVKPNAVASHLVKVDEDQSKIK